MENDASHTKSYISDDLLKKLVNLCIQVENVFGSPQDIEWAIVKVCFTVFKSYLQSLKSYYSKFWLCVYLYAINNIQYVNTIQNQYCMRSLQFKINKIMILVLWQDCIYLLQSRPITSIFAWTNDEITREFDTPFTCDDVVMFYNVKLDPVLIF